MNHTSQNRLAFILTVLFIVVSPIVVLYAIGYRITPGDSIRPNITPTGGVRISLDNNYDIYLNNTLLGKNSAFRDGITDTEVDVTIQSPIPGYTAWKKTLSITPNLVQLIDHVILFPTNPLFSPLVNEPIGSILMFDPKQNTLLYRDTRPGYAGIWKYSFINNTNVQTLDSRKINGVDNQDFIQTQWDPESDQIVTVASIYDKNEVFLITKKQNIYTTQTITSLMPYDPSVINLSIIGVGANQLFFTQGGHLYSLDIPSLSLSSIIASDIVHTTFQDNTVYYTQSTQEYISSYTSQIQTNKKLRLPESIPDIKSIWVSPQQTYLLLQDTNDKLWVSELSNDENQVFNQIAYDESIQDVIFSPQNNEVLIASQTTITLLYLEDREGYKLRNAGDIEKIYSSTSNTLRNVEFLQGNPEYITLIEENTLKAIELDVRGGSVNITTLATDIIQSTNGSFRNQQNFAIQKESGNILSFTFPIKNSLLSL